jgi:hypothetical protein
MKEIAETLRVSPSSVSLWTRDIQLSPEQREHNVREAGKRRGIACTNNGLSIAEIECHWLSALDLPPQCLRRHILNHKPTSSSGLKRRKLPYGVCTLRLGSTRILQHIYGAIQEYAGFEEPRWLDGPPSKPRPRKKREAVPTTGQ